MKNIWKKTCIGGLVTAVFCLVVSPFVYGADAKSIEEMERELKTLKAAVSSLTEQLETVKQEQVASSDSLNTNEKKELEALRNEVDFLKGEFETAAQAEELKGEDITGNVYSEFAKRVKLGARIRTRAEYAQGMYNPPDGTGQFTNSFSEATASTDDDYVLNRVNLTADADVNKHLRMFIDLQDSRAFGASGGTVGNANFADGNFGNNRIDLHQGYADIRNLFDYPLTIRLGRQEIIWGDHRLIGNFIWSNIGRTFDGARVMWDTDDIHAEAIGITVDEDGFDGTGLTSDDDSDESIYGAMLGFKRLVPKGLLEFFYIQKNNQDDENNDAVQDGFDTLGDSDNVVVHNIGYQLQGKLGIDDQIDYQTQGHYQIGDFGKEDHEAWAFFALAGYTCKETPWTPRFGVEYDYASGDDDPDDGDHETFENLYPTNHWKGNYGFMDRQSWQNIHDFRTNITVHPTKKLMVRLDYHYFILDEEADGWYGAPGSPALAVDRASYDDFDDDLAQEVDLTLKYQLYDNVSILAGYSYYKPEDWIEDAEDAGFTNAPDTHWMYLQTTVTF